MKNLARAMLIAAIGFAMTAGAQESGSLNVKTVVQKEVVTVSDSGETQKSLVTADAVVPGDDVVYTITFTNISDESAENVVITNPVSESLTYIKGSAFGPGTAIAFSVDGGATFGDLDELTVTVDGDVKPARPEDVTHVRWAMQGELQAGAQGLARFRARLN